MIITEQNKRNNNEELGATQTFTVTSNSAEALKSKINKANEQSLSRRSNAVSSQIPEHRNPNRQPTVNRQNGVGQNGQHPISARQNPSMTAANVAQNRVQTSAAPQQRQTVLTAHSRPTERPVSHQMTRPTPQQPGQNPSVRPVRTSGSAASQQSVPKNRQVSEERGNIKDVPVRKTAEQTNRIPAPVSRSMMQTKQNSVAGIAKTTPVKEKYDDYGGSDEGGNTVVSILKAVMYIIFVIVISVFLAFGLITVGNDVFAFVKSDEVVELTIPEYATIDDVAEVLFMNDVIKYPEVFKLYAAIKEDNGEFLAGTYSVSPMTNYDDLLDAFKEQPVTGIVRITIPEGSTTDEIIDIFLAKGIGTREGFIDVIENYEFDYWFVKELEEKGVSEDRIYRLDGYLFPDTYDFYLNSSEYTVINKLLKRFTQIFTKEYREQCAAFGYTVDEMITLASIIEKEAGAPSEFFNVSSVFHNRLNAPWNFPKLESDATIVYVISHENGERTAITAADLQYNTPYNTYLYNGFPPGPISNPSASAMLAALSPTETSYYFFIANKGKTYFSETKDEHNAYIAQFKAEAQAANP